MAITVKHKGTPVIFAGRVLVVPPLPLAFIEERGAELEKFTGTLADVSLVVDCLAASLVRNYPEMSRADVLDLVDIGNMEEVMEAVMARSGLIRQLTDDDLGKLEAANP